MTRISNDLLLETTVLAVLFLHREFSHLRVLWLGRNGYFKLYVDIKNALRKKSAIMCDMRESLYSI